VPREKKSVEKVQNKKRKTNWALRQKECGQGKGLSAAHLLWRKMPN